MEKVLNQLLRVKILLGNYSFCTILNNSLISFAKDEETEQLLSSDFEIGHMIRERIVPRAVLYFTGEAIEDDEVGPCHASFFLDVIFSCFHAFFTL